MTYVHTEPVAPVVLVVAVHVPVAFVMLGMLDLEFPYLVATYLASHSVLHLAWPPDLDIAVASNAFQP